MKHHKKTIFLIMPSPLSGKYCTTEYGSINQHYENPGLVFQPRFALFPPNSGKKMLVTLLYRVSELHLERNAVAQFLQLLQNM